MAASTSFFRARVKNVLLKRRKTLEQLGFIRPRYCRSLFTLHLKLSKKPGRSLITRFAFDF
jgi:hypothetical protein